MMTEHIFDELLNTHSVIASGFNSAEGKTCTVIGNEQGIPVAIRFSSPETDFEFEFMDLRLPAPTMEVSLTLSDDEQQEIIQSLKENCERAKLLNWKDESTLKSSVKDDSGFIEPMDFINKPGYVLIGPQGFGHCGFAFDYQSDKFDGCRMGQLLPMIWAQKQLRLALQEALVTGQLKQVYDHGGDVDDVEDFASTFASMVMNMSPYPLGSKENAEFIALLRAEMEKRDREWSKNG